MSTQEASEFLQPFRAYFDREVAQKAAKPLSNGCEIEIRIRKGSAEPEIFVFTKIAGRNQFLEKTAADPQVIFTLTPAAAHAILNDPSDDIGTIGIAISKLIISTDPESRISVKLHAGILTFFSMGYFGVITAGGSRFAGYLASRGLSGIASIKAALQKLRNSN
ncbi:MAG: hypothetical protein A2X94_11040 [Bdellovibrionales bacterium GWB1_55_8]|nr:MAG: hypothetical protein A2X94_11040 [Bdellovibrionales bacterium GWB1_55_8]